MLMQDIEVASSIFADCRATFSAKTNMAFVNSNICFSKISGYRSDICADFSYIRKTAPCATTQYKQLFAADVATTIIHIPLC